MSHKKIVVQVEKLDNTLQPDKSTEGANGTEEQLNTVYKL